MINEYGEQSVASLLHTRRFGRKLLFSETAESTNDMARELAVNGAEEGTTVIAARQSGGRGRHGRAFFSPDGGVYLSVVLRPDTLSEPGCITACVAVAAARAIERVSSLSVAVKWVNDLMLNGKKVGGILAESVLGEGGKPLFVIVGIGINVAETVFPPSLQSIATSLENNGVSVPRQSLAAAFLDEWEIAYDTMASNDFWDEYRRRCCILGKTVWVQQKNERYPAKAVRIDNNGHLWVQKPDGSRRELSSGEVSLGLSEQDEKSLIHQGGQQ